MQSNSGQKSPAGTFKRNILLRHHRNCCSKPTVIYYNLGSEKIGEDNFAHC